MLTNLHVKNLALIDEAEVECGSGCKVSVPVVPKCPIFPLPVAQTYIP